MVFPDPSNLFVRLPIDSLPGRKALLPPSSVRRKGTRVFGYGIRDWGCCGATISGVLSGSPRGGGAPRLLVMNFEVCHGLRLTVGRGNIAGLHACFYIRNFQVAQRTSDEATGTDGLAVTGL